MKNESSLSSSNQSGFTLIELLIVVAVIAVLAAIAYPAYQRHVIESSRSAAQADMMDIAQLYERCFTRTNGYDNCEIDGRTTDNGRYVITVEDESDTFTVTATPQGVGNQTRDRCGTLTLNHLGIRGNSAELPVGDCW